VGVRKLEFEVL